MNKGLVIIGLFLILFMVGAKYIFLPMLVDHIRTRVASYTGTQIASYLVTLENMQRFCVGVTSNVGVFGISIQDIARFISPETVDRCNQFLILMKIISFEIYFYLLGFIFLCVGLAMGKKKEIIIKEVKQEEENEKKYVEVRGEKKKRYCPNCGNCVEQQDKFCGNCGEKL